MLDHWKEKFSFIAGSERKFPFSRITYLFRRFLQAAGCYFNPWVIHGVDFVRSFVLAFLGQCLSINLSAILRKDLNGKFGFSSDGVSASFQLILFRSSWQAIVLILLNDLFTSVLSIWCSENGFLLEISRKCIRSSEMEVAIFPKIIFLVTLL